MGKIGIAIAVWGIVWIAGTGTIHAERWKHAEQDGKDDRTAATQKHRSGEVPFETLRMLSTGMSKSDVLMKAGSPRYRFKNKGTQRWIYPSKDNWIVEVVFAGNNAIAINSTRP